MKYLLIALLLAGCGGSPVKKDTTVEPIVEPVVEPIVEPIIEVKTKYIVAGQSNAALCDWSYFEELTGAEVSSIAVSGKGIEYLISELPNQEYDIGAKAILFVHGEFDSVTENKNYTPRVEDYRVLLGDLPLLISTVGYFKRGNDEIYPDYMFDAIRDEVKNKAEADDNWIIAFDDAKMFPEWGMLNSDGIHFNNDGCMMMMDAMAEATYNL